MIKDNYFKRFQLNKKGFSLVELLAVIVILGILAAIGIGVTSNLIDRAKADKMDSQKNTVTMSAQTYMQNNKNLVPKIIGESTEIKISDLRLSNYLTEDITNNKGESCMEKSYVRVYKLSNTEYTYTTFLYCGDEEVPTQEELPKPVVVGKFSDSSGDAKDERLNNVSDAYLYIELKAGTDSDIQSLKSQGTDLLIDGYSFRIFIVKDGKKQEAYNSGSLSGGRQEKLIINKKLKDYIDVTGITEVSLEVTAINTIGGITNTNTTVSERGKVGSIDYLDTIPPQCVKPASPYNENDWVNKDEYNLTKTQRKLTVGCDDGTGSGCIRNYFTMSWPNDDDIYGAEYVYIDVKDNAGNVSVRNNDCRFRVNVDLQTPEATVTAYASPSGFGKLNTSATIQSFGNKFQNTNSILTKSIKSNDSKTKVNIASTDYKNLVANTTDVQWMNNEKYPEGVAYKIELKDNIRLDKWTWQTNAGYINSTRDANYLKVNLKNPDADSGNIAQDAAHGMTILHGSTHDTVIVKFYTEGMRYGVFTAYDKSGNKIEIEIAANLDRTPPPVPNSLVAYVFNKERTAGTSVTNTGYNFATWTNRYVRVQTAAGQDRDNLTNGVTLSGFWQFYYDARNHSNARVGTKDYNTNSGGIGMYDFVGTAAQVDGKNKIRFMGCDKAGNCSEWGSYKEEWIDITIPVCTVTKTLTKGSESSYGWLGSGETARVTADCNDPTTTLASGCTVASFHHDYNYIINTQTAGAKGNNNAGSFTDYAGNTINCTADKRIQIDYNYPTCSVSGGNSAWTNKSRTVTGTCSDTGGSGCVRNISHTYNYDIETSSGGAAGNGKGGSVTDKADNVTACAANQTVKVDRTMPYVTVNKQPQVFKSNSSVSVTITCHDDLSGLSGRFDKSFSASVPAPFSQSWYIAKCCEDRAGNSMCDDRGPYGDKIEGRHPSCGVQSYKSCRTSGCGVESYNTCRTSGCGVASYKSCKSSSCGRGIDYYECRSGVDGNGGILYTCMPKCGICPNGQWKAHYGYNTCRSSSCGVESYKSCAHSQCGVKQYNKCRHSQCGVEYHKICWHFEQNCSSSPH